MPQPTVEEQLKYKRDQQSEILAKLKANPRSSVIRVAAPEQCNVGQTVQGVYSKDHVPALPIEGCSLEHGCICTYEPILEEIYP